MAQVATIFLHLRQIPVHLRHCTVHLRHQVVLHIHEKGDSLKGNCLLVRVKGLEPIRLAAPDPKSGLSTNSNTPALGLQI